MQSFIRALPHILFGVIAIALLTVTLAGAYFNDSGIFATLFVCVLMTSAAVFLFMYGPLKEFSLGALSAQAKFVRETAAQAQEDAQQVAKQKQAVDDAAKEIEALRDSLTKKIDEVNTLATLAYNQSARLAGVV